MKLGHILGLSALGAVVAGSLVVLRPEPAREAAPEQPATHVKLGKVSTAARQDIDYEIIDRRLQKLMEKPVMVGLAVGIVENGRITFLKGYGETLAGSGEPVTPQTVFRWASVSKGLGATMVVKLAQEGKLDLGAPIADYAPRLRLPNSNERVATVGDVLSHQLGLYRHAFDNKLEEGHDPAFLRTQLSTLNAICKPGTCWSYQNVAYDASSDAVSRVMDMPFPQAVERKLFDPIGMTSGSLSMAGLQSSDSWARPHLTGRRPAPIDDTYYKVPAAGGVNSNIKDLTLWMLAQMGQMPEVLDAETLKILHAPYVETPGERRRLRKYLERVGTAWYGYGWRSYAYAGHRIVGHRGGIRGYRSFILFDPEKKSGVVALWNSDTWQPGGLEFEVMDMVYRLPPRDWLELDKKPGELAPEAPEPENSGDNLR